MGWSLSPWPAVPIGSPVISCAYSLWLPPFRSTSLCDTALHLRFTLFDRYFRKGCYFGLACFANMPVESELERGARMKSVGILCPSYTLLYRYMHFLENQVRLDPLCVVCVPVGVCALVLIFYFSPFFLTISQMCPPLVTAPFCSDVFSSIKHEQRDPVTAFLIYTRFLCRGLDSLSSRRDSAPLIGNTSPYLLIEHGYIHNTVAVG